MRRFLAGPWFAPAVIVLLALVIRVAYFAEIRSSPFFDHPIYDARDYLDWANEIAGGKLVWDQPKLYPPGYPYFLALLRVITGNHVPAMTFANALLGCAWIGLLVPALRRLTPRRVPEVAGVLAATYWLFFHFEAHLLAETWFIFLTVLALFLLTRGEPGARPRGALLAAGLSLGLATITRPNAATVVPFLLPWLWFEARPAHRSRALRDFALVAVPCAAMIVPVVLRTHEVTGLWSLRHHMSLNVYVGNRPGAPGYHTFRPGRDWDRLSEEPARVAGAQTLSEHEAYFRNRVLEFLRDDPAGFAALQLRKLLLFLHRHEIRVILSPYFFDRYAPLQAWPVFPGFGFVGPLALVGLGLALRGGRRAALLYVFAVPQALAVILTVVGSRYRLPVVPFLVPFAAYTLVRVAGWLRARDLRAATPAIVALAFAFWLSNRQVAYARDERFGEEMERVAVAHAERGDVDGAARWWHRAIEGEPGRIETYVGYAGFALVNDRPGEALRATAAGLAAAPADADLLRLRGRALLLAGAADSAVVTLRLSLDAAPGRADAWADLGRALFDRGGEEEALDAFRRSLGIDGDDPDVLLDAALVFHSVGKARADDGLSEGALRQLRRALEIDPENAEAAGRLREWSGVPDRDQ